MSFLCLWKTLFQVLRFSDHVESYLSIDSILCEPMLLVELLLFRLFRKPPDKFYQFDAFVIQVVARTSTAKQLLLSLLRFIHSLFVHPQTLVTTLFNHALDYLHHCTIVYLVVVPHWLWRLCAHFAIMSNHVVTHFAFVTSPDDDSYSGESMPRSLGNWDSDSFPIVIDSATSRTITPFLSDLIDAKPYASTLTGIGNGRITHVGTVRWTVLDIHGSEVIIEDTEAYCSKEAPYRLLCPHSWRQSMNSKRYEAGETEGEGATMSLDPGDSGGYLLAWNRGKTVVEAPLDPQSNLPMVQGVSTYRGFSTFAAAFHCLPTVVADDTDEYEDEPEGDMASKTIRFADGTNFNEPTVRLDDPITHRDEALFLAWHVKLGHAPFRNVRWAAQLGILPPRLAKCRNIVCPACMYGKQKRRPWRTKGSDPTQHKIKKATRPGQCVSVDQLESKTPGLVPQTSGILTKSRYRIATVFVDHYSDLDYVHLQESTSAEETIEGKRKFEQFMADRGVKVEHYHADNGVFASRAFRDEIAKCGQGLSFCGVGAHHQNGVAERRIQDLADAARASLAHAAHRNPSVTANLWPYALRHASYVRRIMPRQGHSKSPEEMCCSTRDIRPTTKYLHTFGCPVYVLKAALQSGGTLPKWDDRSRVGVYLGHSAQHAPTVSLILNPTTGHVSPQFHCVFDDQFDATRTGNDGNFSKQWAEKAGLSTIKSTTPNKEYLAMEIPTNLQVPFTVDNDTEESQQPPIALDVQQTDELPPNNTHQHESTPIAGPTHNEVAENEGVIANEQADDPAADDEVPDEPLPQRNRSRSGRAIRRTRRLAESSILPRLQSFISIAIHVSLVVMTLSDNSVNQLCQFVAYPASIADADTMYLQEAMRQPDKDEFLKAMIKEIEDHTTRGHWRITTRKEMRERNYDYKPIAAIWSFKRKRNPFGDIVKYKARLCCHGGQTIRGVHYDETFSPVVAWSTVRMLLTLSEVYGWHARQIDFVLAFPQAEVRTDVYMQVPEKFRVSEGKLTLDETAPHPSRQDNVVKLIKNVYGLKDASKTWVDHISSGLIDFGFTRSEVDPCLFIKGNLLFCLYVDDAICLTPDKREADKLIKDLEKRGYILTDEGPLSAYLGIQVDRLEGNRISMKQPAFIERIITQSGLKDARMHDTPADIILTRDSNGQERKNDFHYRSLIGQLNYLAATTRPDIQFAVHQCARFCENPKMSHEKAVKRIVRYLRRTKDQGLIMHIDKTKGIECFVDADFAGSFKKENPMKP